MISSVYADPISSELRPSMVVVNTYRDGNKLDSGVGFVVQSDRYNGYLITHAGLVKGTDKITVQTVNDPSEQTAQITYLDQNSDLAILKVNGMELPPFVFSLTKAKVGDRLWSAGLFSSETIAVQLRKTDYPAAFGSYVSQANESSSVVLNACGEMVGAHWGKESTTVDAVSMVSVLKGRHVKVSLAENNCLGVDAKADVAAQEALSAAQFARREAESAQALVGKLESQLALSKENNSDLVKLLNDTKQKTERALLVAQEAEKKARRSLTDMPYQGSVAALAAVQDENLLNQLVQDRLETQKRFNELLKVQQDTIATRDSLMMVLFVVIVCLLIGVIFSLLRNGRRAAVTNSARAKDDSVLPFFDDLKAKDKSTFTEYVLDGRDEDGIRYLLRISGDQMATSDGIVIGRNPKDSPYIINHADVSRKHARLKIMKKRAFIEDLGSTNGTSVNGQNIDEKGPVSVSNGDQIIIGSVVMKLRVLN
jgi:cbb3-type cytochrome oxidase subunit 3